MKRTLVAAILGITTSLATASEGVIWFDTYNSKGGDGQITTFAANVSGHPSGTDPVDFNYTARLLYSLSPISDSAGFGPLLPSWTDAGISAVFQTSTFDAAGYFQAPSYFVLSNYTANTPIYFQVIAFKTSDGSYNASTIRGHSAAFSETLATLPNIPGYMDHMPLWQVGQIPEPSTLALAGLGLASMLFARRCKWTRSVHHE
jgi:hypothetical protein